MKNYRKIISITLFVVMCISFVPFAAWAEETDEAVPELPAEAEIQPAAPSPEPSATTSTALKAEENSSESVLWPEPVSDERELQEVPSAEEEIPNEFLTEEENSDEPLSEEMEPDEDAVFDEELREESGAVSALVGEAAESEAPGEEEISENLISAQATEGTSIPAAAELKWNQHFSGSTSLELPGSMVGILKHTIINKDTGMVLITANRLFDSTSLGKDEKMHWYCSEFHFASPPSGNYYFTATIYDINGYNSSEVAVSDIYHYVQPAEKVAAVTGIEWKESDKSNYRIADLVIPEPERVNGLQAEFYFAKTANETPVRQPGSMLTYDHYYEPLVRLPEELVKQCGSGYYYVRVKLLSKDIAGYQNSEWSEMSPAYHLSNSNVAEFVKRLYMICLDREADADGLNGWVNNLSSGVMTGIEVANQFIFSQEFIAKNYCNKCYVEHLYKAFMGREADEEGLNGWVNALNNRYVTREAVFNGFATSDEFTGICADYGITRGDAVKEPAHGTEPTNFCAACGNETWTGADDFVKRLYEVCLDREPDDEGRQGWSVALKLKQMTGREVARSFIFSKEFEAHRYNNTGYIRHLYKAFMGREADEDGLKGWTTAMQNGYTREMVFDQFAGSKEFEELCLSYGIDVGSVVVEPQTYKVGVAIYQFDDNFMTLYRNELEAYMKSLETDAVKYDIIIVDGKNDTAVQTRQIQNFITQGMDVIILNLVQTSSADAVINSVVGAEIPCILINREPLVYDKDGNIINEAYEGILNNKWVCYVGADTRQSGTYQGEIVAELPNQGDINGDGKVSYIMIEGDPDSIDAQYRTQSCIKALKDAGIAVECLDAQAGNWRQTKGREIAANDLSKFGNDIEVMFCNNDAMALGAAEAIEAAGRTVGKDIYLLGIDALSECVEMVNNGKMTGTVLNDAVGQSHAAVDVAIAALKGEAIRNYYWVDFVKVTRG